jgi:hypothetical protein
MVAEGSSAEKAQEVKKNFLKLCYLHVQERESEITQLKDELLHHRVEIKGGVEFFNRSLL